MSVKAMTTTQIRENLKTIALTWPDGIPWQQADNVNALKGELKRRGETFEKPVDPEVNVSANKSTTASTDDELQTELRALSDRISRDPKNEAAQQRFADVRFELRQRAKNGAEAAPPTRPPLPPRELELPSDDELVLRADLSKLEFPNERLLNSGKSAGEAFRKAITGVADAPTSIPKDPPMSLVDRVSERLLEQALSSLEMKQFADASMLVHSYVTLRASRHLASSSAIGRPDLELTSST